MKAISIIHDEHRSLAAVLYGMLYVLREIRLRGASPDFDLLDSMVRYIDAFSERFHHPKEDAYLFKFLGMRYPDARPLIDRLGSEHRAGREKLRALERSFLRYQQRGSGEFNAAAKAAQAFAAFHWDHMRTEEDRLLPLARIHLAADDWKAIDAALTGETDPSLGAEAGAEYAAMFRRIVDLAPRPIGVAPAR
jgi:hemerythrin-like domain-containing protein